MSANPGLERCLSFIHCQLQAKGRLPHPGEPGGPRAVTISRQAGAGGHAVAEELVEFFQQHAPPEGWRWTIFDRNLVETVLEDHKLPQRLARFMPEDRISSMADALDELFGLHPPRQTLVRQTTETILRLAELGNVILIGRGASLITAHLSAVIHVRLVGSLPRRIEHLAELRHLTAAAAEEQIHELDRGRERYVRTYFNKDINDPLLYHLVVNTDLLSYGAAAQLIGLAALQGTAPAAQPSLRAAA